MSTDTLQIFGGTVTVTRDVVKYGYYWRIARLDVRDVKINGRTYSGDAEYVLRHYGKSLNLSELRNEDGNTLTEKAHAKLFPEIEKFLESSEVTNEPTDDEKRAYLTQTLQRRAVYEVGSLTYNMLRASSSEGLEGLLTDDDAERFLIESMEDYVKAYRETHPKS